MAAQLNIEPLHGGRTAPPVVVHVFASNLAGRHTFMQVRDWGAIRGRAVGMQGSSYAIPTHDALLNALPLEAIAKHVSIFLAFASGHPEHLFQVGPIGSSALYGACDIAPMFEGHPQNVHLPLAFFPIKVAPHD